MAIEKPKTTDETVDALWLITVGMDESSLLSIARNTEREVREMKDLFIKFLYEHKLDDLQVTVKDKKDERIETVQTIRHIDDMSIRKTALYISMVSGVSSLVAILKSFGFF